jgi:hypothetical protein
MFFFLLHSLAKLDRLDTEDDISNSPSTVSCNNADTSVRGSTSSSA